MSTHPPQDAQVSGPKAKRAKFVLVGLVAVALVGASTAYALSRGKESTDDAQVEGHVLSVSSRIPGQVLKVRVRDNQVVEANEVLVELDGAELSARLELAKADQLSAKASLELAEAQLSITDRNITASLKQARGGVTQAASGVAASRAQVDQAKAEVAAAEARAKLATLDLDRVRGLASSGSISQAEVDSRQAAYDQASAALTQARARFDATQSNVTGGFGSVEQAQGRLVAAEAGPQQMEAARAQVNLATARLKQTEASVHLAELNLSYATIRSPARGVVSRRNVELGHMVSPERPLLAIVALDDVWVVANYKEDQMGTMRQGQRALVSIDAFPGRKLSAHVDSVAGGTGSRFALLPPDNASGNYVKVVQRIPVLIRLDDKQDVELRPGMSAEVTVFLR